MDLKRAKQYGTARKLKKKKKKGWKWAKESKLIRGESTESVNPDHGRGGNGETKPIWVCFIL